MCLGFVPLTFLVSLEILAHFMMGNLDLTLPAYYFCTTYKNRTLQTEYGVYASEIKV